MFHQAQTSLTFQGEPVLVSLGQCSGADTWRNLGSTEGRQSPTTENHSFGGHMRQTSCSCPLKFSENDGKPLIQRGLPLLRSHAHGSLSSCVFKIRAQIVPSVCRVEFIVKRPPHPYIPTGYSKPPNSTIVAYMILACGLLLVTTATKSSSAKAVIPSQNTASPVVV